MGIPLHASDRLTSMTSVTEVGDGLGVTLAAVPRARNEAGPPSHQ